LQLIVWVDGTEVDKERFNHAYESLTMRESSTALEESHLVDEVVEEEQIV